MIRIDFKEPTDEKWKNWKSKCEKATQELIKRAQSGDEIVITDLYKERKDVFTKHNDYFFGKCVYCESLITNTHPGDIEHFRPKGSVTDLNNKPIIINKDDGSEMPHPGYYWLAYEVSNLMPACEDCNRPSSGNSEGKKIGKWMKFPVIGNHACKPGEEDNEEPILINPVVEDPEEHLEIDTIGILHPKANSERGKTCIAVFGLNDRPSLVGERIRTYKDVKDKLLLLILAIGTKSPQVTERFSVIDSYKKGKRPYSMAAKRAINDFAKETNLKSIFQ